MASRFTRQPPGENGLIQHNNAVLGAPLFIQRSIGELAVLEGSDLLGLDEGYYPIHTVSLIRKPLRSVGGWVGEKYQSEWDVGTAPLIPKHSVLSFRTEVPYDLTTIHLPDHLFSKAADGVIDLSTVELDFRNVATPATTHLIDVMSKIGADEGMSGWPLLIESVATSLAVSILCSISPYANREYAYKPYGLGPSKRKRVIDYIESNLHRPITLDELAGVCSLSVFHFTRMFKVYYGMSPLRYLAYRRVDAAKHMLMLSKEPLAQIAFSCGFASQSHFTTKFKAVTGVTPAAYRRMIN